MNPPLNATTLSTSGSAKPGSLASAVLCTFGTVCLGLFLFSLDDPRYAVMAMLLLVLLGSLLFVERKMDLMRNLLVFSISLRVLNANVGKRIPSLEVAMPNLNIFEILLLLTFWGLIWRRLSTGERLRFPKTREHAMFGLFVALFFVSLTLITPSPEIGFDRFLTVTEMYLLYIALYNLCTREEHVLSVVRVLLATVFVELFLVGTEIVSGTSSPLFSFVAGSEIAQAGSEGVVAGRHISGSFGDAVVFGWVLAFLFFLLLPFTILDHEGLNISRRWRIVALVAVFGFGIITMTRTSLAGQLVLAPLGIYLVARAENPSLIRWIPRLFSIFIVFIILLFLIPGASDIVVRRSSDEGELENSLELRLVSWNVGLKVLQDFPILGMGVGSGSVLAYSDQLLDKYVTDSVEQERLSYAGIHNGHAIMFAEMGIVGYILYLGLLIAFLRRSLALVRHGPALLSKQVGAGAVMVIGYLVISDFTGVALAFKSAMFYVSLAFALVSIQHAAIPMGAASDGAK